MRYNADREEYTEKKIKSQRTSLLVKEIAYKSKPQCIGIKGPLWVQEANACTPRRETLAVDICKYFLEKVL